MLTLEEKKHLFAESMAIYAAVVQDILLACASEDEFRAQMRQVYVEVGKSYTPSMPAREKRMGFVR